MEQSPSSEVDSFSANQICTFYGTHKGVIQCSQEPALILVLNQTDPVNAVPSYFTSIVILSCHVA